jgi:predicted transcriptional regulator
MQVPPDLASRLSRIAALSGRSPEALLREAISRMIEATTPTFATLDETPRQTGFVAQPQRFSVYE